MTANLRDRGSREAVSKDTYDIAENLNQIREGVFCSMDIPPLFEYTSMNNGVFEDGGVIDNLPIRFGTEIEECDLLFILPLNASFETEVNHRSVFKRLARVMDIRQGVLERNSFKMIYLYNELASLRKRISELNASLPPLKEESNGHPDLKTLAENKTGDRALKRIHDVVHVFSICPSPELKITTTQFWKTKEAGESFQFMYKATRNELKRFDRMVNSKEIRMALVCHDDSIHHGQSLVEASTDEMSDKWIRKVAPADGSPAMPYQVNYFKDF
ncbi:MAG: hypothetical protein ABR577_19290 [Pyrinomonadaceae bacterium]